jgi:hypothetical protein
MEKNYQYRLVPEWNSAFRIQEDCCYDQLVYDGDQTGLVGKMDKKCEMIGLLLCMCYDTPKILDYCEAEFNTLLKKVNDARTPVESD